MNQDNVSQMAAQFTAAYQALKKKKEVEKLLTIIQPMILSAKADGITDRELIEIINSLGLREKFYPAKLTSLRTKLGTALEHAPVTDGEEHSPCESDPSQVFQSSFNGDCNGAPQ